MAQDAIDRAVAEAGLRAEPCATAHLKLIGSGALLGRGAGRCQALLLPGFCCLHVRRALPMCSTHPSVFYLQPVADGFHPALFTEVGLQACSGSGRLLLPRWAPWAARWRLQRLHVYPCALPHPTPPPFLTQVAQNYVVPHRPGAIDTHVAKYLVGALRGAAGRCGALWNIVRDTAGAEGHCGTLGWNPRTHTHRGHYRTPPPPPPPRPNHPDCAASYGDRAGEVTHIAEARKLGKRIVRGYPILEAEVIYAGEGRGGGGAGAAAAAAGRECSAGVLLLAELGLALPLRGEGPCT